MRLLLLLLLLFSGSLSVEDNLNSLLEKAEEEEAVNATDNSTTAVAYLVEDLNHTIYETLTCKQPLHSAILVNTLQHLYVSGANTSELQMLTPPCCRMLTPPCCRC